ncbi:unnamed protein product, partial [Heterosigma akashiwo]
MTGILTGSPKNIVNLEEKIRLFGIYLSATKSSDDIKNLQQMLRLTDKEALLAKEGAFRERVRNGGSAALRNPDGALNPAAVTQVEAAAEDLMLPRSSVDQYFEEVYALELTRATASGSSMPSAADKALLDELAAAAKLRPDLVAALHDKIGAPIFRQVLELQAGGARRPGRPGPQRALRALWTGASGSA